jgi:5-methyltetrahydrofolate--homocysteine methyltransferase
MRTGRDGRSLLVIGENVHATRVVKRDGGRVGPGPDGRLAISFTTADGAPASLPLHPAVAADAMASGRVRHVRSALLTALAAEAPGAGTDERADGTLARAYLAAMVVRQVAAGADWLDVNVDEVADDPAVRVAAMRLAVAIVGDASKKPVSLDSSDAELLRIGLESLPTGDPPALLNSATLERPDVLDLAAAHDASVVLSAAADTDLPATADAKVDAAARVIEAATGRGIGLERLHMDVLVLPVAVDPAAGASFLEAVGRLRERYGPALHLTGGLSNVSFGLPARRLLNDTFIDLAITAGLDSAIVDPIATDWAKALDPDRDDAAYRLAADALTGRDAYCMAFVAAHRAGTLVAGG